MQRGLYTKIEAGKESDDIEQWFAEIERAGLAASQKLIEGRRLSQGEWHDMIRMYAAQEVRTPQSFFEAMERWDRGMPDRIKTTVDQSLQGLEHDSGLAKRIRDTPVSEELYDVFNVELHAPQDPENSVATLSISATMGRRFWLAMMRQVMTSTPMDVLLGHSWSILTPADGLEWPLTDHPALRLAYRRDGPLGFAAGWGQEKADLMMPISPWHLLYVQVGEKLDRFVEVDVETTHEMQRVLLERAYRLIFASTPSDGISAARPRVVDRALFEREREMWQRWPSEQSAAEMESNGA